MIENQQNNIDFINSIEFKDELTVDEINKMRKIHLIWYGFKPRVCYQCAKVIVNLRNALIEKRDDLIYTDKK